jgi:maltose alpha-D-glucosyltransferase/alpha-amylase
MQWSGGWNGGFSTADPETIYAPLLLNPVYGFQAINVSSQRRFDHSLLSWMKLLIRVRKASPALSRGAIEFLYPANHRVLAYLRKLENETVLVVNNLSSKAQALELDLKTYRGNILIEMFGRNIFPRIGELPYLLTLGPYQFYWFRLRRI